MSKSDFNIDIIDLPDRENTVAEIDYKKCQWAEISAEEPYNYIIQIYKHPEKEYWEFSFDEAMEILKSAKKQLEKFQRTPEAQAEYDAMKKEQENWKPTPEETAEYERQMKEQWEKYYG